MSERRRRGGDRGGAAQRLKREPLGEVTPANWPVNYDEKFAAPMRVVLERILTACIEFATAAG